jgi:hypothetical protein
MHSTPRLDNKSEFPHRTMALAVSCSDRTMIRILKPSNLVSIGDSEAETYATKTEVLSREK